MTSSGHQFSERRVSKGLTTTVTVNRQLLQIDAGSVKPWHERIHGDLYFGPPKTASSQRTVPVEQAVIDVRARHLAKYPAGIAGLIFTTAEGLPIRRNRFWGKPWATAKRRAGLGRNVVLHDLRHFYASLLIYQGLNVKQVQKRLGHKSAVETLDTYAACFDAAEDDLTRDAAMGMLPRIVAALDGEVTVPPTAQEGM